jgi:hypothetical protein
MLQSRNISEAYEWWKRTRDIVQKYDLAPRYVIPYQKHFGLDPSGSAV